MFAGLAGEGFALERFRISVEKITVPLAGLRGEFKLAMISDLHYGGHRAPLTILAETMQTLHPDAVAIVGDLLSDLSGLDQVESLLKAMNLPCFVVPGNWEHYLDWPGWEQQDFYRRLGAEYLLNSHSAELSDSGIQLAGIDDPFVGLDDLESAIKGFNPNRPLVLLSHSPRIAKRAAKAGVDITLCGHTHGGQIRIPGIGALIVPPGSDGYEMGMYSVGKMPLYVNRGIGTCMVPARFLCPPEITLFSFVPEGLGASSQAGESPILEST